MGDEEFAVCPKCNKSSNAAKYIALFLLVAAAAIYYYSTVFSYYPVKTKKSAKNNTTNQTKEASTKTNPIIEVEEDTQRVTIYLKQMIKLSGMSAAEILEMRQYAVKGVISLGDVSEYKPSEKVFFIEDGLPWIGAHEGSCNGVNGNNNIGEGESRESIGILNPELLFYVNIPHYTSGDKSLCSEADYMIPRKLIYYQGKNTLVAYIDYRSLLNKRYHQHTFILSDSNARDFGYNWAYADKFYSINFKTDHNFSKQISQTKGLWHKGFACGLPTGCNNYSPYDPTKHFDIINAPASINIKLWKDEPSSVDQKADINFMLVFE